MNDDWLRGDLSDLDARACMGDLLQTVQQACAADRDVSALFVALAEHDRVAAAELAAGMRAVPHVIAVRGALHAAPVLEDVMSPAGLYGRLASLVPELAPEILAVAVQRHPTASWLTSLSRRIEAVPGTAVLAATRGTAHYESSCKRCAEAGFFDALCVSVAEQPDLTPLLAAIRARGPYPALPVAAATVHADPDLLIVEAVAAVVGPGVDAWAQALFAQTERDPGFAARYADMLRID